MFTNKFGEEFVRDDLAISGKYLYLPTQDQDIAYCDERTWSVPASYTSGHACNEPGNGVVVGENGPVVVLRDDIVCTRFSRRRCEFDRLEIPNLLVRGFGSTTGLRRACLVVRFSAAFLSLAT